MKSLFKLIVFVLFVGGWALAAGAVYVVRTPERVIVLPKERMRFPETYTDVRAWTLNDVAAHPELTRRLIESGKVSALTRAAGGGDETQVTATIEDTLANGPPATAPSGEAMPKRTSPEAPMERPPVNPKRRSV